jgi:hypothetical protein
MNALGEMGARPPIELDSRPPDSDVDTDGKIVGSTVLVSMSAC